MLNDETILDVSEDEESTITVSQDDVGERLDRLVSEKCNISRSLAAKLIENGDVSVNGSLPSKNYKTREGDVISVTLPAPEPYETLPENIPIDVIYEDGDIIVVNKPQGMIVHPATNIYTGTLVNALLYHCKDSLSGIGGVARPGIVHRIDKDTSGLLVVAKNDDSHLSLSEQLKTHDVSRVYHAIVTGNIKTDVGTVNKPIGRHPSDRKKMAVISDSVHKSRDAVTHFEVLERFSLPSGSFTYVKCILETGRTHQIRVHMSSIGHPLIGDTVYGGGGTKFEATAKSLLMGQCLHAKELRLRHPKSNEEMHFECELPENFKALLEKLRAQSV